MSRIFLGKWWHWGVLVGIVAALWLAGRERLHVIHPRRPNNPPDSFPNFFNPISHLPEPAWPPSQKPSHPNTTKRNRLQSYP